MAIYGWIYANAKLRGARLDYQVRGGYRELSAFCGKTDTVLPMISYRMMSVDERNLKPDLPPTWFAGFLDPEKQYYAVATGATQGQLLDEMVSAGIYRSQFCTLAYVFTGKDIRRYRQDSGMFAPLKQKLLEIQLAEKESERPEDSCLMEIDLSGYSMEQDQSDGTARPEGGANKSNLFPSTPEKDAWAWQQSLQRPVLTAAPLRQDAKKFLDMAQFADGLVTVAGGQEESYVPLSRRTPPPKKAQPPTEESARPTTTGTNARTGIYGRSAEKTRRDYKTGSSTVNRAGRGNGPDVPGKQASKNSASSGFTDFLADAASGVGTFLDTLWQHGNESVRAVKQSFGSNQMPKKDKQTEGAGYPSYGYQNRAGSQSVSPPTPPVACKGAISGDGEAAVKAAPAPEPKLQTEQQVLAVYNKWKQEQKGVFAPDEIDNPLLPEYACLLNKTRPQTQRQMMIALEKAVYDPDLLSEISRLREALFPSTADEPMETGDGTEDEAERGG